MNIATKKVDVTKEAAALLEKMGVAKELYIGGDMPSYSPVTGEKIASLKTVSAVEAAAKIEQAHEAFKAWRLVPAPKRGELIRLLGEELRAFKADPRIASGPLVLAAADVTTLVIYLGLGTRLLL